MTDTDNTSEHGIWGTVTVNSDDDVAHATMRGKHQLQLDEPEWVDIGNDLAPSPGDYLCVAVAGCQLEVLKQCFARARIDEYEITVDVTREGKREGDAPEPFPEHTSTRYERIVLELSVETTPEFESRVRRCLDVCEDACIVSRSVEAGVDVSLEKSLTVK
jgi:uncharacterized OsmC-like protein